MAFPTTGLLSSFDGSDENPLATEWTCPMYATLGNLRRVSNQVVDDAHGSAFSTGYYDVGTFGPDCEGWVTVVTKQATNDECEVFLRVGSVGTAVITGYSILLRVQAGTDIVRIVRYDAGSPTILTPDISQEFANGDGLGAEIVGSTISAYRRDSGVWTLLGSRTDATYSSAGYLGLAISHTGTGAVLDDFGGGTVVTAEYQSYYATRRRTVGAR